MTETMEAALCPFENAFGFQIGPTDLSRDYVLCHGPRTVPFSDNLLFKDAKEINKTYVSSRFNGWL